MLKNVTEYSYDPSTDAPVLDGMRQDSLVEVVDPETQETIDLINLKEFDEYLGDYTAPEYKRIPQRRIPQPPKIELPAFRGGPQTSLADTEIKKGIEDYTIAVLEEIFDGNNDLGIIDLDYLKRRPEKNVKKQRTQGKSREEEFAEEDLPKNMLSTIVGMFDHRPGSGEGISTLRHIFRGDKKGGLHVPSAAPGLLESLPDDHDVNRPFNVILEKGGVPKMKVAMVNGQKTFVPVETTMFPVSWDNLAILQAISDAWQHRNEYPESMTSNGKSNIYRVPIETIHFGGKLALEEGLVMKLVTDNKDIPKLEIVRTAFPDI